ncbi:vomeronasal type-2 receptor 1-like [Bombina bombina]|uniref:vomeronasal type-2 receptor 1-like n=1 Tax=Bombina bombina TaxID=8345 RepID=UPI00235A60AF|nr:vomeronasal type-2 receptor 1-like [Bombina bombina]
MASKVFWGLVALILSLQDHFYVQSQECRLIGKFDLHGFLEAKNHELIIGGMFPFHFRTILTNDSVMEEPKSPKCEGFNFRSLRWAKAMMYAIEEINNRNDILPNITLGYQIFDTCFTISKAVESTLTFLTGQNETHPNFRCSAGAPLAAVIGAGGSALSIATARILGLYYFPQVGYASSCSVLSDKFQFPSFLRTIPSDVTQSKAMSELVTYFGWSWVGTIAADDDYGKYGIKLFKEEVEKHGVCISFSETLPRIYNKESIDKIVEAIRKSSANIIVIFSSDIDLSSLMEALAQTNITGKTYISSEAWTTSALIAKPEYINFLAGTIGFAVRRTELPGFEDFLYDIHPEHGTDDLVYEFWEEAFNCTWPTNRASFYTNISAEATVAGRKRNISPVLCTGRERLKDIKNTYTDVSQLRITYSVYKSIYTIAHALDDLDKCIQGNGPFPSKSCAQLLDFEPWQLMYYLRNAKFSLFNNDSINFDDSGDVKGYYDILNWQYITNETIGFTNIGYFKSTDIGSGTEIKIMNSSIFWNTANGLFYLVLSRSQVLFGLGLKDARECISCPSDFWSNSYRNECVLKEVEFLATDEALGITLIFLAVFGSSLVIVFTVIYTMYRETALVKANDRELSFLIQISLVCTFMTSILFVGKPEAWSCMARQTTLALGFSLCLSCILGKTIVLMLSKRAAKSKVADKKNQIIMKPLYQKIVAVIGLTIETGICTAYLILYPPWVYKNMESQNVKIILECNEGSIEFLCSMFGFDVFLAILCFLTAFVARKLPDNFNEAKFITFGMLVFFIVWISFVPAYLSTRGKFKVAVEIFAILASSFGLLGCIFVPKGYIILLKPERNTEEIVGGRAATNDKSAPATSASITSEVNSTTVSTVVLDE